MDLSTVGTKVSKEIYFMWEEFLSDIELIWSNATTFNPQGTEVYNMAIKMKSHFDEMKSLETSELFRKKKPLPKKVAPVVKKTKMQKPLTY